jgi:hypothetical protein
MISMTARPKKAHAVVALALAASGILAAHGAEPPVSPQTLGAADATIEFCSTADAPRAEQYRAQAGLFSNGATDDQLSELRNTPEYKSAYDAGMAAFQQMTQDEALGTCKKLLQRTP